MSKKLLFATFATTALIFSGALLLGQGPGGGKGKAKAGQVVEPIRQLSGDLYMITGGGANTLVRLLDDAVIVVDTKNPSQENYDRLMEEIRSVTDLPVRYVINTQHHPDHVGTNQQFIDAGATVIAVEELAQFMASDPRTTEIPGRPTQTFSDDYELTIDGETIVEAHFYGPGHTGGDTIVYFPQERYVMVGDQMADGAPIVDFANGGSAVTWNNSLNGALSLPFEYAIQGRGEPKTRAEVEAFRDNWDKMLDAARAAIAAGATAENLGDRIDADQLAWMFRGNFWGSVYEELAAN